MSTDVPAATKRRVALPVRIGLVLAALLAVGEIINAVPQFAEDPVFPAAFVLVSVVSLAAVPFAWRGSTRARVVVIVTRVLTALGATPAFFVAEVSTGWVVAAAVGIVLELIAVVLLLSGPRSVR